ncbi:MAG: YjjG family noncanonical pyrimidine nucleotidase [Oscillospiraceae bacterium]
MMRYEFVLLDADNTLFDFDTAERKALHDVLRSRGYTPDRVTVDTYLNINTALWDAFARGEVEQDFLLVERFRRFEQAMGGSHDPAAFNADYLAGLASHGDLLPGALELCKALSQRGCTLAIVTNGATVAQRGRYDASPLREYIPHLFISQELGARKPDPLFFDLVCRKLDISDRSRAVVVGDNLGSDILGGNRAGIDTIWYNPHGAPLSGPARPTYTVKDFDTVFAVISGNINEESS